MAFLNINSKGEPGLIFPFVAHSIETGVMQDDQELAGGFALWGKDGEPGKVYSTKPSGGVFLGIAQLTTVNEEYKKGDIVNVVKKGRIWVKVSAEVLANKPAYVDDSGNFSAETSGTAIAGATFKTNAAADGIAELEIA